jgi:pyrimidine operon attenuation protein / uracil phosphoribosyltransferase
MQSRELYNAAKLQAVLQRLSFQVLEDHPGLDNLCMLGIQPRGIYLGERLHQILKTQAGKSLDYGKLDVTFYRDDVRHHEKLLLPNSTEVPFIIEGRNVLMVDDVLYTGRTIRAAMDAMLAFGRPRQVQLLALIDRRGMRQLPIEADYIGIAVDTLANEKVMVQWQERHGQDSVRLENPTDSE